MRWEDIKVGLTIRYVGSLNSVLTNWTGIIRSVYPNLNSFCVRLERPYQGSVFHIFSHAENWQLVELSPEAEEQRLDQQRRLEHAMKYL